MEEIMNILLLWIGHFKNGGSLEIMKILGY